MEAPTASSISAVGTPQSDKCRLLELPAELRNTIYELVLKHNDLDSSHKCRKACSHAPLLKTCRQIRREALPVFYAVNQFVFRLTPTCRKEKSLCEADWKELEELLDLDLDIVRNLGGITMVACNTTLELSKQMRGGIAGLGVKLFRDPNAALYWCCWALKQNNVSSLSESGLSRTVIQRKVKAQRSFEATLDHVFWNKETEGWRVDGRRLVDCLVACMIWPILFTEEQALKRLRAAR